MHSAQCTRSGEWPMTQKKQSLHRCPSCEEKNQWNEQPAPVAYMVLWFFWLYCWLNLQLGRQAAKSSALWAWRMQNYYWSNLCRWPYLPMAAGDCCHTPPVVHGHCVWYLHLPPAMLPGCSREGWSWAVFPPKSLWDQVLRVLLRLLPHMKQHVYSRTIMEELGICTLCLLWGKRCLWSTLSLGVDSHLPYCRWVLSCSTLAS